MKNTENTLKCAFLIVMALVAGYAALFAMKFLITIVWVIVQAVVFVAVLTVLCRGIRLAIEKLWRKFV